MMLDLAEALNPLLEARQDRLEDGTEDDEDVAETTLQLVFFDGEEAFKDWTHTDSVYGARYLNHTNVVNMQLKIRVLRHLAERWSTTYINPHSKRRLLRDPISTEISTIEHLILLDLLGAPNPYIRSFFPDTGWLYDAMIDAERKLGNNGHFDVDGQASNHWTSWFIPRTGFEGAFSFIEDDHLPFIQRGVSILHIITDPFPMVWHKLSVRV
jgi:glutaminyl-peptide cyclotransferase